ncbi:deoxyguanosine kinase [Mycoplasmopsis canis UFG4]|uniref:Deoxyguanosine kinase n=2 Tax=Mycoplasmopsis canis TaxID=29555 RepID=I1A5S2_9BACT|nr:deoxynucleoside kinase [Mycoplasmopsis canis]AMD81088.1 deoxyguanosine kinase [Mycoplasmopsis canis PG 14]EIE39847.1 deoxyguanosine kinase [Mycoplasmopsis canis PG 14]EIE40277.1 deoxyguanosine kinase [Mycoplasmopsis canis UF33]EIE41843.1 deoxyguanosine kinase [Mycoplasmopsis canis UFG4]WQQ12313.1 deoxynucleoside kinase [Mycoplasmopsis canis]
MLIGISGMISSGKSTLTKKLHNHYKTSLMLEEYEENNVVFNQFLEWLYEKQPNLTMGFQTYVVENHTTKLNEIIKKFKELNKNFKEDHIFLDRFSIEHYIFANVNLRPKGESYLKGYDALFEHLITKEETPDLAIYLDMSYETFEKRLFERGRAVEIDNYQLNKSYFETLYNLYKELFEKQAKKYNLNYVIINTDNLNEEQVFEKAKEIIDTFDRNKVDR